MNVCVFALPVCLFRFRFRLTFRFLFFFSAFDAFNLTMRCACHCIGGIWCVCSAPYSLTHSHLFMRSIPTDTLKWFGFWYWFIISNCDCVHLPPSYTYVCAPYVYRLCIGYTIKPNTPSIYTLRHLIRIILGTAQFSRSLPSAWFHWLRWVFISVVICRSLSRNQKQPCSRQNKKTQMWMRASWVLCASFSCLFGVCFFYSLRSVRNIIRRKKIVLFWFFFFSCCVSWLIKCKVFELFGNVYYAININITDKKMKKNQIFILIENLW